MHIPDSMLQGVVCPVTAVISAVGVITVAWLSLKPEAHKPSAAYFAAVAALIFAAQMLNFPVLHGTSGHLLGGVLAASLLGVPLGVLAIAVVVTLQSLVFADGGITVLGANVLNMALIGAGIGGMLQQRLAAFWPGVVGNLLATALAAWVAVMLAALAVSVELAVDGQIALAQVLPAMLGVHALIGVGEALITVAVYVFLRSGEARSGTAVVVPFVTAVLVGLLLSPFASSFPDGLEWVAAEYRFLHDAAPLFVAPLPDYAMPTLTHAALATGLAGLTGVLLAFGLGWVLVRGLERWAASLRA